MEHYFEQAREMLLSRDVILAVVGALVSTFVIYICTVVLRFRLPDLAGTLFWDKFSDELMIVASEVKTAYDPQIRAGDNSELFFPSEVTATNNLINFARSRYDQEPKLISGRSDFDRIKDKNLLILGGSKYNDVAGRFLNEIRNELFYIFRRLLPGAEKLSEHELKVFAGRDANYPDLTYDFESETQPVTIILRKGLYAEGKSVLLVAGLRQEGSMAGIDWLITRPTSFWRRAAKAEKGFQAMIRCRVISQDKVSNIQTIFYQELS